MKMITVYLKSGGNCTLETSEPMRDLKHKYRDLLNPKKKKVLLELGDKESLTFIPKENIACINVAEVSK